MKNNFVDIHNWKKQDLEKIFEKTAELKQNPFQKHLKNKTMSMIFEKPSTRTRVSFETGMTQLGGHAQFLGPEHMQLGRGETIEDTAKVLSRYVDVITARLFEHQEMLDLAKSAEIPVVNGLTDWLHPCQALTDLYTVKENKGLDVTLTYVGDGNNVCHSLMQICSKLNVPMKVGCPEDYEPDQEILDRVKTTEVMHSPEKAVKNADVVYTDVWTSMGKEKEARKRKKVFPPFQVNQSLLKHANNDAIAMHGLPAHRGLEITSEVMDGEQSVVFDQAENRMHCQKALLLELLS